MFIANDIAAFKTNFSQGLQQMLCADAEGLGAFILVLANSMQDETLYARLSPAIRKTFAQLSTQTLHQENDDKTVFLALKQTGIEQLSHWQSRQKIPWKLIYNPLRALRPARSAQQKIKHIYQAFNPQGFNFNKAFLRPEILWEGVHQQCHLRVLYNKFPFAPWHLLIVPEAEQQHPQFLTQKMHDYMMNLSIEYADIFTGFGIGFNSLGAYASINQLHFQAFIQAEKLPIESKHWHHNGGDTVYPIHCIPCDNAHTAWQLIASYHDNNQAYNILYRANICYIIPRQMQGSVALPDWAQGLAWLELCGVFTISEQQLSTHLSTEEIEYTLSRLQLGTA